MESITTFSIYRERKDRGGNPYEKNDLLHFKYQIKSIKNFLPVDLEREKY